MFISVAARNLKLGHCLFQLRSRDVRSNNGTKGEGYLPAQCMPFVLLDVVLVLLHYGCAQGVLHVPYGCLLKTSRA